VSCQKAMGVAREMAESFKGQLDVKFYTMDSQEAKKHHFKGATVVYFENEAVPIKVAMDKIQMEAFLSERINPQSGPENN